MISFSHIRTASLLGLAGLLWLSNQSLQADQLKAIDVFSPSQLRKSSTSWRPGTATPQPRPESQNPVGIRFPCTFNAANTRVYWDKAIRLDLSNYDILELDLSCAQPAAVGSIGVYLKSGAGWYLWLKPLQGAGRHKLLLHLADAATEGQPKGWNSISAIRLSVSKAADSNVAIVAHALRARTCSLVVVQGSASVTAQSEINAARSAAARVSRWLSAQGIPHARIDDQAVIKGRLRAARVAVLPYNPQPPRQELRALSAFVKGGGKLIVCYAAEPRLGELMGVTLGKYKAAPQPGQWSSFAFDSAAPPYLPAVVFQESGNIRPVYPAAFNARVIAHWRNSKGSSLSEPAWVQSERGFWMSHILLDGDDANKQQMLLALLGSLDANLWLYAAEDAWNKSGRIASFSNLPEALAALRRQPSPTTQALLPQIEAQDRRLRGYVEQRQYPEVLSAANELRSLLQRAYAAAWQPRPGEFRGVWNHSGAGLYPGDWNATCRILANSGINAVFPNLAWGGLAHYSSRYLPASAMVKNSGDQLKQSAAAARRYGLEIHAWKICWQLGPAPAALIAQLRQAGRLQKTDSGETLEWLCPSHPANISQELNVIAEMIARAKLDGIHLDYARYPSARACFCDGCRKRFELWQGHAVRRWPADVQSGPLQQTFKAWRAAQITNFIRAASELLRRSDPKIKLSIAVYGSYPTCADQLGQDWGAWLQEGLVDFVCPMNYSANNASFDALLQRQMAMPKAAGRLFPGIGVTATESRLAPDQVIEQILQTRAKGTGGFMLFDLNRTLEKEVLPALSLGVTRVN